jgi:hypothetical protein
MAKVASLTRTAIYRGLEERQFKVEEVSLLKSGLVGRYRLIVVSPEFKSLPEGERQAVLWNVLKENWERQDQLRLTLCLGLTPAEARGEFN